MRVLVFTIFSWLILSLSAVQSFAYECSAVFYDKESLKEPKTNISIYSTVFLKIECKSLPQGENTLDVNWINPNNKVYTHDQNTFVVESESPWVFVFSFRLLEKGPFARSFAGTDFSRENYGDWTVDCYLGGEKILSEQFNLH